MMKRLFDEVQTIGELEARYLLELAANPAPPGMDQKAIDRYEDREREINRQYDQAKRRIGART